LGEIPILSFLCDVDVFIGALPVCAAMAGQILWPASHLGN
jgi:hypothetical protein